MKQKGQVILILILVMTVALGIGLSIVQKSLVDISTASKVEQSSRAFSAAEAGVEKALQGSANTSKLPLGNSSTILPVVDSGQKPAVAAFGNLQGALEYPPLAKEDVVQVWLADLNSLSNPPAAIYKQDSLEVYWGNSSTDPAALELTLVYYDGTGYRSRKWYLDNQSAIRNPPNNFDKITCSGKILGINTYNCYTRLTALPAIQPNILMLLRVRLLYNTTSQPFAVQAVGTCGTDCSLPPQAREIISTGISGETQRKVKLFQENKVVPPFFDYAIFSAGEINK